MKVSVLFALLSAASTVVALPAAPMDGAADLAARAAKPTTTTKAPAAKAAAATATPAAKAPASKAPAAKAPAPTKTTGTASASKTTGTAAASGTKRPTRKKTKAQPEVLPQAIKPVPTTPSKSPKWSAKNHPEETQEKPKELTEKKDDKKTGTKTTDTKKTETKTTAAKKTGK